MHAEKEFPQRYDIIVIGGGAAGFFAAINAAEQAIGARILILEKTTKLLSKVKISGGGRCNVTHHCFEPTPLSRHYPRGQKELKKMFRSFQAQDTVDWFSSRGITLKTEDDGRMFPETDDSQTIIDCFLGEARRYNIDIETGNGATVLGFGGGIFSIETASGKALYAHHVIVAIGGHPQAQAYSFLEKTGHTIVPILPSLFTFNDAEKKFSDLMGVSVPDAEVKIAGSSFSQRGPVLITHWGLSGPAVITLSSWAAVWLHEKQYDFTALVNWTGTVTEDSLRTILHQQREKNGKRKISNYPLFEIPQRLWDRLVTLAEIPESKTWSDSSNKDLNRLIECMIRCPFRIHGKTTFKEEFVSCGGVDLDEVHQETMESKIVADLYFAGEVLNIDGETGGFNFQSAWTTGFLAAKAIAKKMGVLPGRS